VSDAGELPSAWSGDRRLTAPAAIPVTADIAGTTQANSLGLSPRSNTSRGAAEKGSRHCLQRYVEHRPEDLRDLIICHSASLGAFESEAWQWKSPLRSEEYYEYRDDFLEPLGLAHYQAELRRFWPKNGPQWDALALLSGKTGPGVLLVEAKAHPRELSTPCDASPASRERIQAAMETVRVYMNGESSDWLGWSYQLANRIAFLYFLNEVVGVPTWLALINFVNDRSHRPTNLPEWRLHHQSALRSLGIHPGCRLLDRMVPLFIEPI
jgi:hypothetical protein